MKICILGGAGYIGSALIPKLLTRQAELTVVDLFWFGDNLPAAVRKIKADARTLTMEFFQEFESVIFLAGLSNDPMADFSPFDNFVSNGAIPAYIAHLCAKAGVKRFIHGGSCSVYGRMTGTAYETDMPRTFSAYGVSKLQGEVGCAQQAHTGMTVVNFRMGTVCGMSPRMRFDLIVNAMVRDAIKKQVITINDPDAKRPILDIRDAAEAYIAAAENNIVSGIYNLTSCNVRVSDVAVSVMHRVDKMRGVKARLDTKHVQDVRSYAAKSSRPFITTLPAVRSLIETIDHVIINVDWDHTDVYAQRFSNIETFKALKASEQQPAELCKSDSIVGFDRRTSRA